MAATSGQEQGEVGKEMGEVGQEPVLIKGIIPPQKSKNLKKFQ